MQWHDLGMKVNEAREEFQKDKVDSWNRLNEVVQHSMPQIQNLKLEQFNPLDLSMNIMNPVVATIMGDDNEVNHAVAFVHGYIFDSNLDQALILDMESLNWCVS